MGKSTLIGMIAKNCRADVNVIGLIGERGREVREFLERDVGEEGLKRSVVVVSTSEQAALARIKGAYAATAIAEYFRDQGKDVILLMDSITRFATAQREIGLATGEPPASKGYTPSVFAALPKLLERTGNSDKGSITAFYTILVEGDDLTEPVTDISRSILDGHIVLDRSIAARQQYPAIDIMESISRNMPDVVDHDHLNAATEFKEMYALYESSRDLIEIGAYEPGTNPRIDRAIDLNPRMIGYLRQLTGDSFSPEETKMGLVDLFSGAGGPSEAPASPEADLTAEAIGLDRGAIRLEPGPAAPAPSEEPPAVPAEDANQAPSTDAPEGPAENIAAL